MSALTYATNEFVLVSCEEMNSDLRRTVQWITGFLNNCGFEIRERAFFYKCELFNYHRSFNFLGPHSVVNWSNAIEQMCVAVSNKVRKTRIIGVQCVLSLKEKYL